MSTTSNVARASRSGSASRAAPVSWLATAIPSIAAAGNAGEERRAQTGSAVTRPRASSTITRTAGSRRGPSQAVALAREDIRVTMPPYPMVYDGVDAIRPLLEQGLTEPGEWRLVATRANRMPAAACYLRAHGETEFRAFKIDVLRIEDGRIAEITTFGNALFPAFGLAPTL